MSRKVRDRRLLRLIGCYLRAGDVPPWRRSYWTVLKSGLGRLGLAAMATGELLTKLAFFGRKQPETAYAIN